MTIKFEEVDTAPCRLFLTEDEVFPYHWQEVVGVMKSVIQQESRLNLNNRRVHIMFHTEVADPLFDTEFCSIGLEVVGPSSEIDEEFSFYDRDETTVLQVVIPFKRAILGKELFDIVRTEQEKGVLSSLWEIVFCDDSEGLRCEINLFKK